MGVCKRVHTSEAVDRAIKARQKEHKKVFGEEVTKEKMIDILLLQNINSINERTEELKQLRIKI